MTGIQQAICPVVFASNKHLLLALVPLSIPPKLSLGLRPGLQPGHHIHIAQDNALGVIVITLKAALRDRGQLPKKRKTKGSPIIMQHSYFPIYSTGFPNYME